MSLVAHGGVHVSQTSAEMRLFSENLHVVTSRSWYNFVETRHIGWSNGKLCSKLYIIMDSCVKKVRTNTSFSTANLSHSAFAESKPMETFHPDMSTYVKSCTRTRPRKSKWCRVISWSVVVVSRRGQLFLVDGVYILWLLCTRIYWDIWLGKTAVNVWTNVRGGITRVGGHETRPKTKPNVDYHLVTYYYYYYCYY